MMKFFGLLLLGTGCLLFAAGCGESTVDASLNKAAIRAEKGDWKGAMKSARHAVDLDSNSVPALIFRAIACERNGERDLALDSARRATELNPDNFIAQYTLGRLYAQDPGRTPDALKALLRAERLNPNDLNTLILLSNISVAVRSDNALNYLNRLRQLPEYADSPILNNDIAISLVNRRDYQQAKNFFLAACKSNQPQIVLNTAIFMDRYTDSKSHAKAFYRHFLNLTKSLPEFDVQRAAVENRLTRLN